MKQKILIALVVLAAGLGTLLAYDSGAGEMLRNTLSALDSHVSKFTLSSLSLLSAEQVGIIIMVVIIAAVTIFLRGGDKDKI